jgi:ankyrin repeat protein
MHWVAFIEHNLSSEDLRALMEADPTFIHEIDGQLFKATPAHYAAAVTIASNQKLIFLSTVSESYPRIAYMKDRNGWQPLHYAAKYSESVEMLELLLQLNPSATSTASIDQAGMLPIHLLTGRADMEDNHKIAMMKCLTEADPSSATALDGHGDTVLHILCACVCSSREALIHLWLSIAPQLATVRGKHGSLPLHVISNRQFMDSKSADLLKLLLDTYTEGAGIPDDRGRLPLHFVANVFDLVSVKLLLEVYPAALTNISETCGSPLSQAVARKDSQGMAIAQYLYELWPGGIREALEDNWLPLHFVAGFGTLDSIRFLTSKYPEAARITAEGALPLHVLFDGFLTGDKTTLSVNDIDILRELLACYPEGAGKPSSTGSTPYDLAVEYEMPVLIRQLLLRADPTIDPAELRRLNYMERRMAMFLAYSAIPKTTADSFVVRLRRVKNKDETLLRLIVSFL